MPNLVLRPSSGYNLLTFLKPRVCYSQWWFPNGGSSFVGTSNCPTPFEEEMDGILFREYCFGEENSLSFTANSVSSAKNSVSSLWHTNNRLRGTH